VVVGKTGSVVVVGKTGSVVAVGKTGSVVAVEKTDFDEIVVGILKPVLTKAQLQLHSVVVVEL